MRKTLTAAAALAPLWFAVSAGQAVATTTISNGRTTPISTSTANNGAADNIDIASGGSVTLNTAGSAVNLNSSNTVTNEGTVSFSGVDNAIGVLISGGNTGSFTNSGSITVNESTSTTDSNSDGVNEAPYAKGTGRYGILVQGGSAFTGDIVNSGTVTVVGNNSYGISVEAPLTGNLTHSGVLTLTGDNGIALRETKGISGNLLISGSVSATGQNTQAVSLTGDVGGRFSIYGAITSTGYGATSRSLYNTIQTTIQNTASEVQQGGSAVVVAASVAGGVYIGAPPTSNITTDTTSTADVNGDGVADATEATGSITTYGAAPAMVIGSTGRDVALGAVQLTTTPANTYGLIVNGNIAGQGVFDGISATGLQIGVAGGTVHIAGGVSVGGTISATAYGADSTAVHLLSGSVVPTINVTGGISAATAEPLPNATTGAATPYTGSAYGLVIDSGAAVNTLNVAGTISASATGDSNSAYAVIDNGGGISTVNLSGHIIASITPSATGLTTTGSNVGLDLHNNTSGVVLTMTQAPQTTSTVVTANSITTTTVTTGPVVQNTTGAAITSSTTSSDGKTVTTVTTPAAPSIVGDVLLGSGNNTVDLEAGTVAGKLDLGSGIASMTLNNGASYTGGLFYSGSGLALNIVNGSLTTTNAATLRASSLNIGANGTLNFAIDPANNKATNFIVSGAATIASGAKLGINLVSLLPGPQTYTLIKAGSLSVSGADVSLASEVPYLFFASVASNQAAGTLNLTVRQKTASEMGLNPGESAALSGVYNALPKDAAIESALFAQYDKAGFTKLYDQLLPDYSGGIFRAASEASRTISRLTSEPNQIENPTGSRGAWAQQFFIGADQARGDSPAFRAGGFGYVGGVETGGMGFGAVGATAAFVAVNLSDPHSPGDNRTGMSGLEGGLYWQGETGGLALDARIGAGFDWFSARRQFLVFDSTGAITTNRQTKGSWTGYSLTGHFGAAYNIDLGSTFFVRPQVHFDYFRLDEGSYTERFGGDGMNLAYDNRVGDEASGTASMVFGAKLGRTFIWRPQLELGVRDVFSGTAGDTTARFAAGGSAFTLSPDDITGPSGVARIKLKGSSEYYEVGIEAGGEVKSRYGEGDFKLTVRVLF
jgi:hypothetical protein